MTTTSLRRIGSRHAVTLPATATAIELARLMRERDIGSIIIVRGVVPVGIVTDRDLALRVVAAGMDPGRMRAAEVMSAPVVTVGDDTEPLEAAAKMREKKVRRLPIVGPAGDLVGIITFDDLVHHFGRASSEMSEVVGAFPLPHTGG